MQYSLWSHDLNPTFMDQNFLFFFILFTEIKWSRVYNDLYWHAISSREKLNLIFLKSIWRLKQYKEQLKIYLTWHTIGMFMFLSVNLSFALMDMFSVLTINLYENLEIHSWNSIIMKPVSFIWIKFVHFRSIMILYWYNKWVKIAHGKFKSLYNLIWDII